MANTEWATIYARPAGAPLSRADVEAAVATYARLRAEGWALRSHKLRWLRELLGKAGLPVDERLQSSDVAAD